MTVDEAVARAIKEFPFEGYVTEEKGAYWETARTVMRYLQPGNARILDFGSGACDRTSVLQFLGFQCTACDDLMDHWHVLPGNREKIMSFINACGIDFRLLDGETLPLEKNTFDMVMLHHVLEHLHNSPRNLLNDLLEFVKPEGLLFVTVPNAVNIRKRIDVLRGRTNLPRFDGYYWYPDPWRGHVREYVKGDLAKLCEFLNLEILELRSCDDFLRVLPKSVRPLYLFVTKLFPGWKDSWLLVARKRPGWTPRKTLPEDELAHVLNRATSYKYKVEAKEVGS